MQIIIGGKAAALKENTSFEFVAENRAFTDADSYTLSISFPLAGCPQNIEIFGNINRADVAADKVVFDCELRDHHICRFGAIAVTEISEAEVKCQFLEGRSEQNFNNTFDEIYINQLDLGSPSTVSTSAIAPMKAWKDGVSDLTFVALPWVNEYSGNIQNIAEYEEGTFSWSSDTQGLSWMPYLVFITSKICEAVGYACDISQWLNDPERRYYLICNALPYAWLKPGFANALPNWSVTEWFEKLEMLLEGEFDIDHRAKKITFNYTTSIVNDIDPVEIKTIIDEHSKEISADDSLCEYKEATNLAYADSSHSMWKFYSCDWVLKNSPIKNYASISDFLKDYDESANVYSTGGRTEHLNMHRLYYIQDIDQYIIIVATEKIKVQETPFGNVYTVKGKPMPVNTFGKRIVDNSENADENEIEFTPVCIEETEDKYGPLAFMPLSSLENDTTSETTLADERTEAWWPTGYIEDRLSAGEVSKQSEYLDKVFIGIWKGELDSKRPDWLPRPTVQDIFFYNDWSYTYAPTKLRINNRNINNTRQVWQINPKVKVSFKFLADDIPNPRALFFIRGKRYLCEKITATFTEKGMSQLLKGDFYPVID